MGGQSTHLSTATLSSQHDRGVCVVARNAWRKSDNFHSHLCDSETGKRRDIDRSLSDRLSRRIVFAVAGLLSVLLIAQPTIGANESSFKRGEAHAAGTTFTVNIKQGNANIGFTYGRTRANYQDTTGTAEAHGLDLGVFTTLFGVPQCDGSPAILNPETFPPQTRVDSAHPEATKSRRAEAYHPGEGLGPKGSLAGYQDATATTTPSAQGLTENLPIDTGIMQLVGGKSVSNAGLFGQLRTADATVTADRLVLFGGVFIFYEPRWHAAVKSGAQKEEVATFTFKSATLFGVDRSHTAIMEDLSGFKGLLQDLLGGLGVTLDLPRAIIEDEKAVITPMAFRVVDPPFGSANIAPFLGSIQEQRDRWQAQMLAEDCKNDVGLLFLDIILNILSGSGTLEFEAGGAEAWTADTDYPPPFDLTIPQPREVSAPTTTVEVDHVVESTGFGTDVLDSWTSNDMDFALDDFDMGIDDFDLGFEDTGFEDDLLTNEIDDTTPIDDTSLPKEDTATSNEVAAAPIPTKSTLENTSRTVGIVVGIIALLGAVGLSLGDRLFSNRVSRRIP